MINRLILILLIISVPVVMFLVYTKIGSADSICGPGDTCEPESSATGEVCQEQYQLCDCTPGYADYALEFDGDEQYVDVDDPKNESLDFGTGDFSVGAFVKTTATKKQAVISKGANGKPGFVVSVNGRDLHFEMRDSSGSTFAVFLRSPNIQVNDGQWHHVAWSVDRDGKVSGFVDGLQVDARTITGAFGSISGSDEFYIGRARQEGQYFNGTIDDVQVYDYFLWLANNLAGGNEEPGVVGRWKFDENKGSKVNDSSLNKNSGDLENDPDWASGRFNCDGRQWTQFQCDDITYSGQCEISGLSCGWNECGNCGIVAQGDCSLGDPISNGCPLAPEVGRTIIDFDSVSNSTKIVADGTLEEASRGPFAVSILPGNYKVTLVSQDIIHPEAIDEQFNESYQVILRDSLGIDIVTTASISDIPNENQWLIETVENDLNIPVDISSVLAIHSQFFDSTTSNSVLPVCAAFDSVGLSVSLSALPDSGSAPLNSVLSALVAGNTGTINYSFWWDCNYAGTSVSEANTQCGTLTAPSPGSCVETSGIGYKCDGILAQTQLTPIYTYWLSSIAKIIAERGGDSVEDSMPINISNFPPTISSVVVNEPDYCLIGPSGSEIVWDYSDPEGQPQGWYYIQIAEGPGFDFDNPVVDTDKTVDATGFTFSYFPPPGSLNFGSTYKARVKSWDDTDLESAWVESGTWPTANHAYPSASFSFSPTEPSVNQTVQFTDKSISYGGTSIVNWLWDFDDGGATSIAQNPVYTFTEEGLYQINLTVTDSDDLQCAGSQAVDVGGIIPIWKEISPRE